MTEITFRSDVTVDLIDFIGGDERVTQAAKVSTIGSASVDAKAQAGLINFLIKNRHASPLEHSVFTFYIEAPIFVARESHRHRIASLNEESGRYRELKPVFYVPSLKRPVVQVGKTGEYRFEQGSWDQKLLAEESAKEAAELTWYLYQKQLGAGIAKEVAREVLPVSIYTSWYMTINARSLINFLSLRTKDDRATVPSYPQFEIDLVARKMEASLKEKMPIVYSAFNEGGRASV